MTLGEFRCAFGALSLAIQHPRNRKPVSLFRATDGFRRGTLGNPKDIKKLSKLTLEQLFDLRYQLEVQDAKGNQTKREEKES